MIMPRNPLSAFLLVAAMVVSSPSLAYDDLPAKERLKSCNPRIALTAAKEILGSPEVQKEPLEMFPAAFALFQNGDRDEAVFWFYAAQLRTRYQLAFQSGDRGQLLAVMMMTVGAPINNYAYQDARKLDRVIDRVLDWDKTTPNPLRERPRAADVEKKVEQAYAGLRELKVNLVAERDDIERKAKAASPQMEQMAAQLKTPPCKPGKPDPAFINRIIEAEEKSVTEFAMTHPSVLRESGAIKFADAAQYQQDTDSGLPTRYTISIDGTKKRVYAEVKVLRTADRSSFALACVTQLSPGQRDPFKDVCAP